MINEITEYSEYMNIYNSLQEIFAEENREHQYFENILKYRTDIEGNAWDEGRMTVKDSKLNVSGDLRAMQILARGELFGTDENADWKDISEADVQNVIAFLQNWHHVVVVEHAERFLNFCLSSSLPEAEKRRNSAQKKLDELNEVVNNINAQKVGQKSGYYTFYSIVADAADAGPLSSAEPSVRLKEIAMLISLASPGYRDATKDALIATFIWLYIYYLFRLSNNDQDESGFILINIADMERWLALANGRLIDRIKKIEEIVNSYCAKALGLSAEEAHPHTQKLMTLECSDETVKIRFDMERLQPDNFLGRRGNLSKFDNWNKAIKAMMSARRYDDDSITVKDIFGSNLQRMEKFIRDSRRFIRC